MNKKMQVVFYGVGSLGYALSQWLVLTFVSRFSGASAAGQYILALAYLTPLTILFNLGLRNALATDVKSEFKLFEYKSIRLVSIFLLIPISILGAYLLDELHLWFFLALSIKVSDSFSELVYGYWLNISNEFKYGVSQLMRLFFFVFFSALTFYIFNSSTGLAFIFPISILFVFLLYDFKKSAVYWTQGFAINKKLFLQIVPLALASTTVALNVSIPRLLWDFFYTPTELAHYVFLTYFISLIAIPVGALCQAYLNFAAKGNDIRFLLIFTSFVGLIFFMTIVFYGEVLVNAFYGINVNYSLPQLVSVGAAGILQLYVYLMNMHYTALRRFKVLMFVSLFTIASNVLVTSLFFNYFEVLGGYLSLPTVIVIQLLLYPIARKYSK